MKITVHGAGAGEVTRSAYQIADLILRGRANVRE
jgi:hypothetical protein